MNQSTINTVLSTVVGGLILWWITTRYPSAAMPATPQATNGAPQSTGLSSTMSGPQQPVGAHVTAFQQQNITLAAAVSGGSHANSTSGMNQVGPREVK